MLEMFERLLAALIILALLVLVMFIALPEGGRVSAPVDQPRSVEPAVPPSDTARAKPPAAEGQTEVAKNEAPPQPSIPDRAPLTGQTEVAKNDALAPQPPEKAASPQAVQVPNPPGNSAVDTGKKAPPPPPAEKSDALPKQKFVKSNEDRLPADLEFKTAKADKPIEKPVAAKPKADKLRVYTPRIEKLRVDRPRIRTASRLPVQRSGPHVYIKEERETYDGIGEYIQRTDYSRPDWHRTHIDECVDGRCGCSCNRPYWARRGSPCWD